jgi:hypothetical protein
MDDREVIRSFEGFHNIRFLTFAGLAVLAFAIVLTSVIVGFRHNQVSRSADAMTYTQPAPQRAPAPPPAVPVK